MAVLRMSAAATKAASLVGTDTPYDEPNWCLRWCVRHVYNYWGGCRWGGNGSPWAINYWYAAKNWGRVVETSDPYRIPAGAMTFSKGAPVYGHVFIADGKGGCYTTDYPRSTDIGHVSIDSLMRAWGQRLLGYIEVTGEGLDLRNTAPQEATMPTVFDLCVWNIARPRWYTPWSGRAGEIKRELTDEASVYCFQELFEYEQIATVKAALPTCKQFTGPAGLEFLYDSSKWEFVSGANLYSGIARRYAQKVTLKRIYTGQLVDFFNVHAPIEAEGDTAKERYGAWLVGKVKAAVNPVVIAGDLNSSEPYSPKRELRAAGYIGYKEQAAIANEATKEFIPSGKDLCDIRTRPSGIADITGGAVDVSTTSLESDHRRIEARIVITP
jgi:hypothetical protein